MDGEFCKVNTEPRQPTSSSSQQIQYAFGSLTQMDSDVQEEIVLDESALGYAQPSSLISSYNCNPVIREDTQCVDMVLEEEIVTDTTHSMDHGDELMMLLDMNDEVEPKYPAPIQMVTTSSSTNTSVAGTARSSNCRESTEERMLTTNNNVSAVVVAQTQSPLFSLSSSATETLPLVKIVPNSTGGGSVQPKIIMKIQAKDRQESQDSVSNGGGNEPGDADEEEEEEEVEDDGITTAADGGGEIKVMEDGGIKSGRVSREAAVKQRQQQQMVDPEVNKTSPETGRKVRKAVGRPKKKLNATPVTETTESPKRQSTRAIGAQKKTRMFSEIADEGNDDDSTELVNFEATTAVVAAGNEEHNLTMDYPSDNETSESVTSDSMTMRLQKVSSNSAISIVAPPKVRRRMSV